MNDVPLPFLPSTDDPQVKAFIAKEKQAMKERKAAEMRALEEKARKQRDEDRSKMNLRLAGIGIGISALSLLLAFVLH